MSIATNLQKLETDITNAYDAVQTKGGTIPTDKNTNNLATAISSISGGGDIDWSEIGYSGTPQTIIDSFNYAKQISDNWDSSRTNYSYYFENNTNLIYMPLVDTSKGTSFTYMFKGCSNLQIIPKLNTTNGTGFNGMFQLCTQLKTIPQIDTSNGTKFSSMFRECENLIEIPQIDTSKGTSFYTTFDSCKKLKTIPPLNTSNITSFYGMFWNCYNLETIPELDSHKVVELSYFLEGIGATLKNLGGFLNLGEAYLTTQSANYSSYTLDLNYKNNITHDSLMNVINKLYDIATKGCNTQGLKLGSTNLAKLTAEEIGTATNKGWSVS